MLGYRSLFSCCFINGDGWWVVRTRAYLHVRSLNSKTVKCCETQPSQLLYSLAYDYYPVVIVVVDRFYVAVFSALEQTHCALQCRM